MGKGRPGRAPLHPGLRVLRRVTVDDKGCWIWPGPVNASGYGILSVHLRNPPVNRTIFAHRAAYEYLRAPVPKWVDLHHRCHVKRCVNPWHLNPLAHGVHSSHHNAERPLSETCVACGDTNWYFHRSRRYCMTCRAIARQAKRGERHSRKCRCESCIVRRGGDVERAAKSAYDAKRYRERKAAIK